MNDLLPWVLPAIAVGTVIATAAVAISAINRVEQATRQNTNDIQDLKVDVAVLQSLGERN